MKTSVFSLTYAVALALFLAACGPRSPVGRKADARYVDHIRLHARDVDVEARQRANRRASRSVETSA